MHKRSIMYLVVLVLIAGLTWLMLKKRTLQAITKPTTSSVKHLAIIMDGNRRWARERKLQPWLGHKQGIEPLKNSVKVCRELNIPYLSLYAFSLENFKRSPEELSYLFDVIAQELASSELKQLLENNIKVNFIGDRALFPAKLRPLIEDIEQKTESNTALVLNFMFCYGGQQELVASIKDIIIDVQRGVLNINAINEKTVAQYLWTKNLPEPDLIIRTGNTKRLSNFLPYQSAYSELYFLPIFWPDFTQDDLYTALLHYENTKRNFGV